MIRTTIRANQKCFVLRHPDSLPLEGEGRGWGGGAGLVRCWLNTRHLQLLPTRGRRGRLSNKFLLTANLIASDGGATIVGGNERVVRARLSDAKFFWETDQKVEARRPA